MTGTWVGRRYVRSGRRWGLHHRRRRQQRMSNRAGGRL